MSKLFIPLGSNCATTFIGMLCGWCSSINKQLIIKRKTYYIKNSSIFNSIYFENISTMFDMFKNRFEDFLKPEDIIINEDNPNMVSDDVNIYQLYNTRYRYKYCHNFDIETIFKLADFNLNTFASTYKLYVDYFVKQITQNKCVFAYFVQNNDEVESINKCFKEFNNVICSFNPNNEMWYFVGNDLNKIECLNTVVFEASTNECLNMKSNYNDTVFKLKSIIDQTNSKNNFVQYFDKKIGITKYDKYLSMKIIQISNPLLLLIYLLQNDKTFYKLFYYYKKQYPGIKLILDSNSNKLERYQILIKNYIECTDETHLNDVNNTYLTLYNYNAKNLINISDIIEKYLKMKYKN